MAQEDFIEWLSPSQRLCSMELFLILRKT